MIGKTATASDERDLETVLYAAPKVEKVIISVAWISPLSFLSTKVMQCDPSGL